MPIRLGLKSLLLVTIIAFFLVSSPVLADTSAEVTVTATGWVAGYSEDFILTYIYDNQIDITWTKSEDAVNTLIRTASGHVLQIELMVTKFTIVMARVVVIQP